MPKNLPMNVYDLESSKGIGNINILERVENTKAKKNIENNRSGKKKFLSEDEFFKLLDSRGYV